MVAKLIVLARARISDVTLSWATLKMTAAVWRWMSPPCVKAWTNAGSPERCASRRSSTCEQSAVSSTATGGATYRRRRTRLRLLKDRELVLFEQHVPQLRRGVDVEVGARRLMDGPLKGGELGGKRPGNLAQPSDVDPHPAPLHIHQHREERQLDRTEQADELVILELRLERGDEPQHDLGVGGAVAGGVRQRHRRERPQRLAPPHELRVGPNDE